MIVETDNPKGFVCIDDVRFDISVGGIRLISGVDQNETCLLAKAMSLKLHTFGLPLSGAKAGISSDDIEDLYRFIAHPEIKELIQGTSDHQFITGPDMGTSEEEYHRALQNAGLKEFIRPGLLSQNSDKYNLPMDNIVTALGTVVVMEELMKENKMSDPLANIRIVLEGFGKVGTGIAKIVGSRAKIVGISTRYGCIKADPSSDFVEAGGLVVDDLVELQQRHGDEFIKYTDLTILPTEELFSIPADIVVPGARTEAITLSIAQKIRNANYRAVVPVANWPYTKRGRRFLELSGIICFPDFIASAGAVIAAMIEFAGMGGQQEASDLVRAAITTETRDLLLSTKACGDGTKSLFDVAMNRAIRKKTHLLSKKTQSISDLAQSLVQRYLPNLL